MRKILSILLAITIMFSLVACSNSTNDANNNEAANNKPVDTDINTNEPTIDNKPIEWELKDLTISVPEINIETYTIEGVDKTFEVGVTVYNFTGKGIIETLNKNEFVNKNYIIDQIPSWDEHGFLSDYDTDNGKIYNSHYVIGEFASADNDYSSIFAHAGRKTYEFKNSDGFYLSFNGLDINKQAQIDTLSVLTDFIGEEMANYLVYAKDADGKKYDDDLDNEFQLHEEIESGKFIYVLERELQNNGEYRSDITYSIDIKVNNYQLNYLMESNHDYESKYQDFKYKPEYIFSNLETIDPNNHVDVLKEYYLIGSEDKYGYSLTDDVPISYSYSTYQDTVYETYTYAFNSDKTNIDSYFSDESLMLRYSCDDINGKLIDLYMDIEGDIEVDEKMSDIDMVAKAQDLVKRKLNYILPDLKLDLSTIKAGEETEIVGRYRHALVDGEWEYTLTVDLTCKYDDEICFDFEWRSANAINN